MFDRISVIAVLVVAFLMAVLGACGDSSDAQEDSLSGKTDSTEVEIPANLTFWEHVAPVVFENCTPCHHEGGAGPFPLTSFGDLQKRTKTIRLVIADGYMPPWPADPNFSTFKNQKILSAYEKVVILNWIEQGAPEGVRPDVLPQPKILVEENLGPPDLIIPFPENIAIDGVSRDKFFVAKLAFELPRDTVLKAMYFSPGNKQLIHHVNGHLINYEKYKKTDVFEGEWIADAEQTDRAEVYSKMGLANDDGTYPPLLVSAFNYLPGVEPLAYPEGIGGVYINQKGAFLLNTLHYGPSPVDITDNSEIHLYFAEKKPERPLKELQLGTLGISPVEPEFVIPANEISSFSTRYSVTEDISVLTVNPHMHLLGQTFTAFAVSPNKQDTINLIHIPEWDFRWQYFYTYPTMLKIPKGYEIVANATFDNTMENPLNPNKPPVTLKEGGAQMKTTDEMFQFFITYVPFRAGDENFKL